MIAEVVAILIEKEILDEQDKDIYIYCIITFIEKLITYTILLVIAVLIGKLMEGIVFCIAFITLRKTTGGLHLKSYFGCIIASVITMLLAIEVIGPLVLNYKVLSCMVFFLSVGIILRLAPVNHPSFMLSDLEIKYYKIWSRFVLAIESGMICIGYMIDSDYIVFVISAIDVCSFYILIAKIIGQEVKVNGE